MSQKQLYTVCCLLLAVFIVTRLVLNVYTPLMDPSEARYAVFAKNMTQSGNWQQPTYNFEGVETVFVGKPPLAFQMSMACCKALGISEFATRLPAFLSALLILWFVWRFVKKWRDAQTAAYAVLLTCSSFLFYMYAGQCMTDLILTAAIVGAIFSYAGFERELGNREWGIGNSNSPSANLNTTAYCPRGLKPTATDIEPLRGSSGSASASPTPHSSLLTPHYKVYSVLFFVFIALGVLVKGPVAIVMSGLPVFFYVLINNRWRNLKYHAWLSGTIVFLLICVPYFMTLEMHHPGFIKYFIVNENINRYLFHEYGDKFGGGRESFYGVSLLWFLLLKLPTVFLLQLYPTKNRNKMYSGNLFNDPLTGISALTCITLTLFWALTSRVLITYLLPTIPFFAVFLAVRFRDSGLLEQPGFSKKLNIFLTTWLILQPILFTGAVYAAIYNTTEMASPVVACAVQEIKKNSDLTERSYYFAGLSPHYAEFYFKDKTQFHIPESIEDSVKNSENDWLFITEKQKERLNKPINRKLIFQKGQWSVYAPSETSVSETQADDVENPSTVLPNN